MQAPSHEVSEQTKERIMKQHQENDQGHKRPSTYAKTAGTVLRGIGGEYFLFKCNEESADFTTIFRMNEIGAFIYNSLDGISELDSIAKVISNKYEIKDSVIHTHIVEFISTLMSLRLVTHVEQE